MGSEGWKIQGHLVQENKSLALNCAENVLLLKLKCMLFNRCIHYLELPPPGGSHTPTHYTPKSIGVSGGSQTPTRCIYQPFIGVVTARMTGRDVGPLLTTAYAYTSVYLVSIVSPALVYLVSFASVMFYPRAFVK